MAGNSHFESRTYEVKAWTLAGFYKPVDMSTSGGVVVNTVKNGSTVPLKFNVFAGPTELTSTDVVETFGVQNSSVCGTAVATDGIEFTTTGGTSLRYDSLGVSSSRTGKPLRSRAHACRSS